MHTRLDSDDRGVSEVVGAILVFGVLVTLLGIIQAQAVPDQNREVEIQHTAQVQEDLIKFHEVASAVAAGGDEQSVAVQSGTGYPSRLLFFNPPRVQGAVSTTGSQTVEIRNVKASGEADDYFTDDASNDLDLSTRRIEYSANYNEVQNDPTIRYEYGVLYSNYSDGTTIQNEGSIIDGNNINLIFAAGDYNRTSSTSQSLAVRPVSAPSRSISVEGTGSNDIVLSLPSELPESEWQELYGSSGSVVNINKPSSDTIEITLDGSQQYNLRTSRIALGTDVPEEDGYYIVPANPGTASVAEGGTANARYEVRDKYNNPVSNVTVRVDKPNSAGSNPVERTTNADGQITVPVTPTDSGTKFATASIRDQSNVDGCTSSPGSKAPRCRAEFTLQVTDLSINPGAGVRLSDSSIVTRPEINVSEVGVTAIGTNTNVVNATFEVTGSSNREIESIRMNLYSTSENGPVTAGMNNSDFSIAIENMEIGGEFYTSSDSEWVNGPETLQSGTKTTYSFLFYESDGSGRVVEQSDYFVLTVKFGNNERAVYFVSPD
ncbi:hypothetical protein BRC88_01875 [Halobacteriales archaeon QS_4_69_225]|nr:MAG: hypothetical protein BRC88_01875 [Halobacteriales archaeon QS_4_69_225]